LIFWLNLISHLHPLFAFSLFLPNHHQSHTPIINHHRPLHHQFAQICSLCCRYRRHPLLPHAVREPFKLQVTTTMKTISELKLEFLWVKFWVKVNHAPALYWKLIKCPWCIYVACSVCPDSENRRWGPILLMVEKCRDFKNIYWNVRTILQSHAKYKDQKHI